MYLSWTISSCSSPAKKVLGFPGNSDEFREPAEKIRESPWKSGNSTPPKLNGDGNGSLFRVNTVASVASAWRQGVAVETASSIAPASPYIYICIGYVCMYVNMYIYIYIHILYIYIYYIVGLLLSIPLPSTFHHLTWGQPHVPMMFQP